MRTRVVIQSRLSSSRLPGKALMMVGGLPLIELVARRAARTGFDVVVATSFESYDERILAALKNTGIPTVVGPLDDVLGRFVLATSDMDEDDIVVRLTGDNPVADADLIQEVIDAVREGGYEYGRVDIAVVPEGLGCEVFPVSLLRRAGREATSKYDREHVTPWIRRHTRELNFAPRANPGSPRVYRATVDCLHDFTRITRLFDEFADPLAVRWTDLMDSLVGKVRSLGPIARDVAGEESGMTTILMGVRRAGITEEGRDATAVRELFTRAVEAGVSDVLCDADQAQIAAVGLLPMLRQRIAIAIRMPLLAESVSPALEFRMLVERARADSGHALRRVYVHERDLAGPSREEILLAVREYADQGLGFQLGVLLDAEQQLTPGDTELCALVAADCDESADRLRQWRDHGLTAVRILDDADVDAIRQARQVADCVVVQPAHKRELTSALSLG